MFFVSYLSLLSGCLINDSLYNARLDALTDDDGDGWSDENGDCNDRDPAISPSAAELCNGVDDNCNGLVDDDPPGHEWLLDADGDGYGGLASVNACDPPDGHVAVGGDCDDDDPRRHPGAEETCDDEDLDEDCDGLADDQDPEGAEGRQPWYIDADGDGHGSDGYVLVSCDQPSGYVSSADDCDDLRSAVHPGQTEQCGNRLDDDCDQTSNECRIIGETSLETAPWSVEGAYGHVLGSAVALLPDSDGDGKGSILVTLSSHYSAWHTGVMHVHINDAAGDLAFAEGEVMEYDVIDRPVERLTIIGDTDGDGRSEFLVSCPDCFDNAGSAYLISLPLSGSSSLASASRTYQDASTGDALGFRISAPGDLNGDGFADAIISAYGSDQRAPNAGAAWLLPGSADGLPGSLGGPTWTGDSAGDSLMSAAGGEDLDGDGVPDLALGTPGRAGLGSFRGAAYVLMGPDLGRALADADGVVMGTSDASFTGFTLLLVPDLNADGLADLAIGSLSDRSCTDEAGGIAIFSGPAAVVAELDEGDACLRADERGDEGGWSLANAGDVDGNGTHDLLIGAPQARDGQGMAWLAYSPFRGNLALSTVGASFVGVTPGDRAGWSLAGGTDVNGDGVPDLAIGSRLETTSPTAAGSIAVFFGTGL